MGGSSVEVRESHVVSQMADVLIASDAADRLAEDIGFPEIERREIVLAVRELATNIVRHAGQGQLTIVADDRTLTVIARDHGPGIPNVDLAVQDGYSTGGSLGYGLGTVNRLMHRMVIESRPGDQTTVTASRSRRDVIEMPAHPRFDVGVATEAKAGGLDNGDQFIVRSWGDTLLVGVIDGVGHGAAAHAAAGAARNYVETHYDQDLDWVMRGTHVACRGTRGVVMALARIRGDRDALEYCSIGNIEARFLGVERPPSLMLRRGILGLNAPEAKVVHAPWPVGATLVLHSDGVSSHWGDRAAGMALTGSAGETAAFLLRKLGKDTDDATVLVVRDMAP